MAIVVVGRRCEPLDSAGIFCRGPLAAGWLKLWWNSYLPPIHSLCAQDTDRILANHIRGARCVRLFTAWSSDDPGCLPFTSPSSSFFGEFASLLEKLRSTTRTSLSLAISIFTWRIPLYQLQLNFAP